MKVLLTDQAGTLDTAQLRNAFFRAREAGAEFLVVHNADRSSRFGPPSDTHPYKLVRAVSKSSVLEDLAWMQYDAGGLVKVACVYDLSKDFDDAITTDHDWLQEGIKAREASWVRGQSELFFAAQRARAERSQNVPVWKRALKKLLP